MQVLPEEPRASALKVVQLPEAYFCHRNRALLLVVRSVEPWKNCAFSVMLADPFAVPLVNTVPPGA